MKPFLLRPVEKKDLRKLKKLILYSKVGIASIPENLNLLRDRIQTSLDSFDLKIKNFTEKSYLFVVEDLQTKELVGVSGIHTHTGQGNYFDVFQLKTEIFSHQPLKIFNDVKMLKRKKIYNGPSELCSLFLHPRFRRAKLSSLVSLSRYLFIGYFSKRFSKKLVANLRGVRDKNGQSPFWNALGKYFFGGKLKKVDTLKSLGQRKFIQDLMPKYPIYVPLLPLEAQDAIQQVYVNTVPALKILQKQGFKISNWVDIFDAGPYLLGNRDQIKAIKNQKKMIVMEILDEDNIEDTHLIANQNLDFRVVHGHAKILSGNKVAISKLIAKTIKVEKGDKVTVLKL